MELQTAECLNAIEHLPEGATIVLHRFSWDDYEALVAALENRKLRVAYDSGRLEVVSPLPEHETVADLLTLFVHALAEELDLEVQSYGSATWRKPSLAKGAEADACFYVANARRVIGKSRFDLEVDPPPDIVAEVDITNESLSKFPIYAALRVPEIWRYDGTTMEFWNLVNGGYRRVANSRFFPDLTPAMLVEALEHSKAGQTKALRAFRKLWRKR